MDTPILIGIIGLLGVPLGALATWFFNRRKSLADMYNSIAEAGQFAVESVSTALDTVRSELEEAHSKIDLLSAQNEKLTVAIAELKTQNETLIEENAHLRRQVSELTDTLNQLVSYEHSKTDTDSLPVYPIDAEP
jgi:regulator of replication initiation timing